MEGERAGAGRAGIVSFPMRHRAREARPFPALTLGTDLFAHRSTKGQILAFQAQELPKGLEGRKLAFIIDRGGGGKVSRASLKLSGFEPSTAFEIGYRDSWGGTAGVDPLEGGRFANSDRGRLLGVGA